MKSSRFEERERERRAYLVMLIALKRKGGTLAEAVYNCDITRQENFRGTKIPPPARSFFPAPFLSLS